MNFKSPYKLYYRRLSDERNCPKVINIKPPARAPINLWGGFYVF